MHYLFLLLFVITTSTVSAQSSTLEVKEEKAHTISKKDYFSYNAKTKVVTVNNSAFIEILTPEAKVLLYTKKNTICLDSLPEGQTYIVTSDKFIKKLKL